MAVVLKDVSYGLNADKLTKTALSIDVDVAGRTARLSVCLLFERGSDARH